MLETNEQYPLVVEFTMYKHNLADNRLLSAIRRNAKLNKIENSDNHFFVSSNEVRSIISDNFTDDILHQSSLIETHLAKDITSVYFVNACINTFSNLKYIKFNVSKSKNYTRLSGDKILFDYKILHAKIDLPALVSSEAELRNIQNLLKEIKFWNDTPFQPQTYIEISSRDLISSINYHESSTGDFIEKYAETIEVLFSYVDMKLESDNASIHLIVKN